jgi:hypothetical protein
MIKKLSLATLLIVVSSVTMAVELITVRGKINRISNYEGHSGTIFNLQDMAATAGQCTRNDFYMLLKPTESSTHTNGHDGFFDEKYSMLLAAKLADREVIVALEKGKCPDGLPKVYSVAIE